MHDGLHQQVDDILGQVKVSGLLNTSGIDQVVDHYSRGNIHWSRLWTLMMLGSLA